MGWGSAVKSKTRQTEEAVRPSFPLHEVDWERLVQLDFETYYDDDYTLRKLSTSEYIRDPRFETLMCGIKIGNKKPKLVHGPKVAEELAKIDWNTHALLCHHTQFDGFILSHHYGVQPRYLYCTLSMARGLHSVEIGAGLDEVSQFYGGHGKLSGGIESMAGLRYKDLVKNKTKWTKAAQYCLNDVEEMSRIFKLMVPKMPADEMDIIDVTCRLFTDPVLKVDEKRAQAALQAELEAKKALLLGIVGKPAYVKARLAQILDDEKLLKKKAYQGWSAEEILLEEVRKTISSNETFSALLAAEGVQVPMKISPAWFKHKDDTKKYTHAFAKTDLAFTSLSEHPRKRVRELVEARLMVKSTINETRAGRLLEAGKGGMPLPVYLRYYGAHTGRWSGGNKMNLQNLERGGELRRSILAPKGHVLVVADSSQIEARVNAWLWDQDDLLEAFRKGDRKEDRDVYCKFADNVYNREITKADELERFVGKVCVLGLGYQMGAPKLQNTLALGTMGPPVFMELDECQKIVNIYRGKNHKIKAGWQICQKIISDMATGRCGTHGPISWEAGLIWLPNGMALKYPDLQLKVDGEFEEWSYLRKGERAKIYGGLLCENIVQALARIIVGGQLLKISKQNRVVMTTHDEVGALAKARHGQVVYDRMVKHMSTPPPWCADIPLNAEGKFDVFYAK